MGYGLPPDHRVYPDHRHSMPPKPIKDREVTAAATRVMGRPSKHLGVTACSTRRLRLCRLRRLRQEHRGGRQCRQQVYPRRSGLRRQGGGDYGCGGRFLHPHEGCRPSKHLGVTACSTRRRTPEKSTIATRKPMPAPAAQTMDSRRGDLPVLYGLRRHHRRHFQGSIGGGE